MSKITEPSILYSAQLFIFIYKESSRVEVARPMVSQWSSPIHHAAELQQCWVSQESSVNIPQLLEVWTKM